MCKFVLLAECEQIVSHLADSRRLRFGSFQLDDEPVPGHSVSGENVDPPRSETAVHREFVLHNIVACTPRRLIPVSEYLALNHIFCCETCTIMGVTVEGQN